MLPRPENEPYSTVSSAPLPLPAPTHSLFFSLTLSLSLRFHSLTLYRTSRRVDRFHRMGIRPNFRPIISVRGCASARTRARTPCHLLSRNRKYGRSFALSLVGYFSSFNFLRASRSFRAISFFLVFVFRVHGDPRDPGEIDRDDDCGQTAKSNTLVIEILLRASYRLRTSSRLRAESITIRQTQRPDHPARRIRARNRSFPRTTSWAIFL